MTDLEKAKKILSDNGFTCVLCKCDETFTSTERGVKPLVLLYESGNDFRGFSAADKVVGRGAAFLYVLLGVNSLYADVISEPALELLETHKITVGYASKVKHIINRKGDGICPFEALVADIVDPETAYRSIRKKMEEMK